MPSAAVGPNRTLAANAHVVFTCIPALQSYANPALVERRTFGALAVLSLRWQLVAPVPGLSSRTKRQRCTTSPAWGATRLSRSISVVTVNGFWIVASQRTLPIVHLPASYSLTRGLPRSGCFKFVRVKLFKLVTLHWSLPLSWRRLV